MYALNRAQIIGQLIQDPEIRKTPSGQSVGDLRIVTKYFFTDRDGNEQEGNAYHSVVVWRGLADICGQYLRAGSSIYISGRIETDSWEDESGDKRYKTRIVADEMIMLDSKNMENEIDIPSSSLVSGSLNKAEIIGNLTRDPDIRQTPTGKNVISFSVATNYSWKDREGNTQEKTEFHNIVIWDKLAEESSKYFKKGKKVYISGRLQTRSWETPDGKKRYTTEIIADKAMYLNSLGKNANIQNTPVSVSTSNTKISDDMIPDINYETDIKPEDLPF